ncbi:hypothetical protein K0H71_22010 [Bacillus sp. IITD106]|nr:hypothetical protein [Bacillus sp. IITD106]
MYNHYYGNVPDGTSYYIRDGISILRYRDNKHTHYYSGEIVMVEIDSCPITHRL